MFSSIQDPLMKFPSGLQLYLQHCGKRLDGIVLRQGVTPVFDITSEDAEENHTRNISPSYLLNYFRCYFIVNSKGKDLKDFVSYRRADNHFNYDLNSHFYRGLVWSEEMDIPNLLAVLFVAEGARKGSSLQELLDENLSPLGYAEIGKDTTLEEQFKVYQELIDEITKILEDLECK